MPKIPGVPHRAAIGALEKAGFYIHREGWHVVMKRGAITLTIPRYDPINAYTLGGIVRDAGLTVEKF